MKSSLQESDQEVDVQAPLMEMGLDSLAATQLVQQLSSEFGIQLAPTLLFNYPTVNALSDHLASLVSTEAQHDQNELAGEVLNQNGSMLDDQNQILWQSMVAQYQAVKKSNELIYCLRQGQPGFAPVLFLYGANGLPFGSQILQHMDVQQPVYCTIGPELLGEVFDKFTDRVSSLASKIRARFGDNLVHFVGYSFGGVSAMAVCGEYQRNGMPFTITVLDPTPIPALRSKESVIPKSALQKRAYSFDAQLGLDLQTQVDVGEIEDTWKLDLEMLRQVGNDSDFAGMMRATVDVGNVMTKEIKEIVDGGYDFEILNTSPAFFISESEIDWFKRKMGDDYDFNDSILSDEIYGWASSFSGEVEKINVNGNHTEFFSHDENVVLLAKHLQKLIESNRAKKHGDQVAASDEVRSRTGSNCQTVLSDRLPQI